MPTKNVLYLVRPKKIWPHNFFVLLNGLRLKSFPGDDLEQFFDLKTFFYKSRIRTKLVCTRPCILFCFFKKNCPFLDSFCLFLVISNKQWVQHNFTLEIYFVTLALDLVLSQSSLHCTFWGFNLFLVKFWNVLFPIFCYWANFHPHCHKWPNIEINHLPIWSHW